MAITVVSGGVQPALDPLKDGDSVLSAYTAQAATLANWETSATGETITDVVAEAFVNGSNSGIIAEEHSAFSPASLFASGETGFFYDISDLSSMNTEPDQSGSVPAVGDAVRFIADKSGNGNHATSSSLAKSPALRQDVDSKYYLEFDGVDDGLLTQSPFDISAADVVSVMFGVEFLDNVSTQRVFMVDTFNNTFWVGINDDRPGLVMHTRKGFDNPFPGASVTIPTSKSVINGSSSSINYESRIQINNEAEVVNSEAETVSGSFSFTSGPITIGERFEGGGENVQMRFYGAHLISRQVTSGEKQDAKSFYASKTGVTL